MRKPLALSCLTLVFGSVALSGSVCRAPEPAAFIATEDGGVGDSGRAPSPDLLLPDDGKIDPPALDSIEHVTVYDTVPIHGVSEPNSTVLVRSSDGITVSVDVSSSGRFCLDVPLVAGTANDFDVTAVDLNGNQSTSVSVSVLQQGAPQQAATPASAENAARGGSATALRLGNSGSVPANEAIDGSASSAIQDNWLRGFTAGLPQPYVIVKLAHAARVNKIRAIAPSDCPFGAPVSLFYSAADAPSPPDVDKMSWVNVANQRSTGGTEAVATMPSAIATHVAVQLQEQYTWTGDGCGWQGREIGVAELEAWTVPNQPPPPPRAPSCTGGAL